MTVNRRTFFKLAGALTSSVGCIPAPATTRAITPAPQTVGAWTIPAGSLVRVTAAGVFVEAGRLMLTRPP